MTTPSRTQHPQLSLPNEPVPVTGAYWKPSRAFVEELAQHLRGKRVLEIFSGNGYLAAWLQSLGVNVLPTTRFTGHDAHSQGLFCEVTELEARAAVRELGAKRDVLLVCWPTVTEAVLQAVQLWGPERPVIFVGEVTDYAKGHLGGCASDAFFDAIEMGHRFASYRGNMLEAAFECQLSSAANHPT